MCKREIRIVKNCNNCKFKCQVDFIQNERQTIFNHFWSLNDERKSHFYNENTKRLVKKTKLTKSTQSRRNFSFAYYFHKHGVAIRV